VWKLSQEIEASHAPRQVSDFEVRLIVRAIYVSKLLHSKKSNTLPPKLGKKRDNQMRERDRSEKCAIYRLLLSHIVPYCQKYIEESSSLQNIRDGVQDEPLFLENGLSEHEGRANLVYCTLISRFSARRRLVVSI